MNTQNQQKFIYNTNSKLSSFTVYKTYKGRREEGKREEGEEGYLPSGISGRISYKPYSVAGIAEDGSLPLSSDSLKLFSARCLTLLCGQPWSKEQVIVTNYE